MLNIIQKLSLLFFLTLTLQAQTGLNQKHLVSLSPDPSAQEISADTSIEVKYDLSISKHSLHKRAVVLKNAKNKNIKGKISIKNKNTLIFTPNAELASGGYKVKVKKLNLQDYTLNTRSARYAKKFCSYFYDDVKECRLYRYATRVKTKQIIYSFRVDDNKPKVISLTLSKSNIQLNEDNTTTISVNAKYDNNKTIDVTNEVEWITSNSNIVRIEKNIITPLSEGITTLQAKFNSQTTAEISVTVYREINGYKLPPEPDETLNNSTLLGIDVNNNGVRDDVERKIVETYREPLKIVPLMITVKIGQEILANPIGLAKEHSAKMDRIDNCTAYLRTAAPNLIDELAYIKFYENNMYNTEERVRAYIDYNRALSGGVYGSGPDDWVAESCDFDVETMLKEIK